MVIDLRLFTSNRKVLGDWSLEFYLDRINVVLDVWQTSDLSKTKKFNVTISNTLGILTNSKADEKKVPRFTKQLTIEGYPLIDLREGYLSVRESYKNLDFVPDLGLRDGSEVQDFAVILRDIAKNRFCKNKVGIVDKIRLK